jgi:hypothetical protein
MFNIIDLICCKTHHLEIANEPNYYIIPANPAVGLLYVTKKNLGFISGHIRMRGKNLGQYPYHYLELIDMIFGKDDNTIEVCSGNVNGSCYKVGLQIWVVNLLVIGTTELSNSSEGGS